MSAALGQTIDRLRRRIVAGTLLPGDRLGEAELAAELGVSRTPVREALRTLAAQGLVEVLPNRGARVTAWTPEDLSEVYELRIVLESHAARRAATTATPATLTVLAEACDRMESAVAGDRLDDLTEWNRRFHQEIVSAARSPRLTTMLESVVYWPMALRTFGCYDPPELARSMHQHRDILAAFHAGDPDWAGGVMTSHIAAARNLLLERFDLTSRKDE